MRFLVFSSLLSGCGALALRANVTGDAEEVGHDQLFHVKPLVDPGSCLGGWNAINPSFTLVPGTTNIAVAMRGLCLQKKDGHASWYSKMVIGTIPSSDIRAELRSDFHWQSLHVAPDLRRLSPHRRECHLPGLDKAEGPEDPRLVKTKEGIFAIVTGYDVVSTEDSVSPACGDRAMLLYAAKVEALSPPKFGNPVQLTFEGMGQVEKNWAMFTPPSFDGANVLAVYSIHPHTIAQMSLEEGNVKFIAHTESEAVSSLAAKMHVDVHDFHGGGGVAHTSNYRGSYFLSVLHTAVRRKDGGKDYWNFPYKFSDKPPYQILRIGKKLPLQLNRNPAYGEYVAFVTTVMVDHHDVFIGYGSGDSSSRTFRMPHDEFEAQFFPRWNLMEEDDVAEDLDSADLELLDSFAQLNLNTTGKCISNMLKGCKDDLTPSVCRKCADDA